MRWPRQRCPEPEAGGARDAGMEAGGAGYSGPVTGGARDVGMEAGGARAIGLEAGDAREPSPKLCRQRREALVWRRGLLRRGTVWW